MGALERLERVLVERTGLMLRTLAPPDAVRLRKRPVFPELSSAPYSASRKSAPRRG